MHTLTDLLYPPACLVCQRRLASLETVFCPTCLAGMPRLLPPRCLRCGIGLPGAFDARLRCGACRNAPPPFDGAAAPWWYAGSTREAIRQFKYRRRWRIGRRLAEDMAAVAHDSLPIEDIEAILPVPLHWAKHRLRGFNPAEQLAQVIAARLAKPCVIGALRRTRWTSTQTRLHGRERFRNVRDAFAVRPERLGRGVLLVDDVLTSGATVAACTMALNAAGVSRVFVLTAARTPLT